MRQINQVFLQLREADRFAHSKNPLLRRWSVILLDNLVELVLQRKSEFEFLTDRTTWYKGVREHNRKFRREVSRQYPTLVAFAHSQGWISEEDTHLLLFTHGVRNRFYHQGLSDPLEAEIAIRLFYMFIKKYFPQWRAGSSGMQISSYEPVPIEMAADDSTGFRPVAVGCEDDPSDFEGLLFSPDHWKAVLSRILTYRSQEDIRALIQRATGEFLDAIESRIYFLTESRHTDFADVLSSRFAVFSGVFTQWYIDRHRITLAGALNIYLAILDHEERLFDIADEDQRADECHKLLQVGSFIQNPLPTESIEVYRSKAETLLDGTEAEGIAVFLQMENELRKIGRALDELALDVDMNDQRMLDEARGK